MPDGDAFAVHFELDLGGLHRGGERARELFEALRRAPVLALEQARRGADQHQVPQGVMAIKLTSDGLQIWHHAPDGR